MSKVPLEPRNWLRRGDRVMMRDGEILTIESLCFGEFAAVERVSETGYFSKRDIVGVVAPEQDDE